MTEFPPIEAWSIAAELIPLKGGARARVFRSKGLAQEVVFKTTRRAPGALTWLDPVQAAARKAGFVVPGLIRAQSGALSVAGWSCEPFLEGMVFGAEDMAGLGPMVARFHDLASALPQRPGFHSSQVLIHQTSGGDIDLSAMPMDLVLHLRDAFQAVQGKAESVIHGDLNPGNLLHLPEDRIALLDWDEARRDLPLFDLVALGAGSPLEKRAAQAWEIACCWKIEPTRARHLARDFMQNAMS